MERLTYPYNDGTHRAAEGLPCGEKSWEYKSLLIEKLGAYEDIGLEPEEIKPYIELAEKMNVCDLVRENKRLSDQIKFLELGVSERRCEDGIKRILVCTGG